MNNISTEKRELLEMGGAFDVGIPPETDVKVDLRVANAFDCHTSSAKRLFGEGESRADGRNTS
jgi:hypothetical protein